MNQSSIAAHERAPDRQQAPRVSAFARYVARMAPTTPSLPIVHTTNALCFREMTELGQMTPQPCNVFVGESLLYFFYGKPSYRLFTDYDSALTAEAPVAIILSKNVVTACKRIFPFDSGGFDRYRKFMPRQFHLPHFELKLQDCVPEQVVGTFFDSNLDYFDGLAKSNSEIPADQFEATSISDLLQYKGKDALDDRAWSIEIQIPNIVELNSKTVLAVVMPSVFLDTSLGRTVQDHWGAEAIPYKLSGRGKPAEYHSTVRDLTRNYLVQNELL